MAFLWAAMFDPHRHLLDAAMALNARWQIFRGASWPGQMLA